MRVMVLLKASPESEAGELPSTEILDAMGRYNDELVNAGVILAGGGLRPERDNRDEVLSPAGRRADRERSRARSAAGARGSALDGVNRHGELDRQPARDA